MAQATSAVAVETDKMSYSLRAGETFPGVIKPKKDYTLDWILLGLKAGVFLYENKEVRIGVGRLLREIGNALDEPKTPGLPASGVFKPGDANAGAKPKGTNEEPTGNKPSNSQPFLRAVPKT